MDDRSTQGRAALLGAALSLERDILARMERLTEGLADDCPYREVIERHRKVLGESVIQIEGALDGDDELGEAG
jgi:hypothetical protein